ncbi:hypothetical protein PCC7424_0852 [Gloeothece citriformis PCC 7424]|uniref:Uncharacterized protein n=1 Tax=Gloeothece citriformis (strain PCC 7424) TaxID=65393 RepID=B7KH99_GLOC7|nr:hypothetical protein [Gloeothece citriformis]ACK69308.1 hypothetical protein PCC7424_0852 [Gloeothece citriformis PCC 7424]
MNRILSRLLIIAVLILIVVAPFSGLAPLMFFLLIAGVLWGLGTLLSSLFSSTENQENS